MKKVQFQLESLTCPTCIKKIESGLGKMEGVEDIKVLFNSSKVKASIDEEQVQADDVKATIEKLGYPVLSVKYCLRRELLIVRAALYYDGGGKGMGKLKKVHVVIISALLLILAFVFHWLDIDVWKKYTLIASTIIAGYSTVKTAMQSIRLRVYFSIELLV